MKTITLQGANNLAIEAYEFEVKNPKVIFMVLHGSVDHKIHYVDFAEAMQHVGILVVLPDLRGHGNSFDEKIGYLSKDHNGWELYKQDLSLIKKAYNEKYPSVPFVVSGHSMGAMLVQDWMTKETVDGAILSGAGYTSPWLMQLGLFVIRQEARKLGYDARSPKLHQLIYGGLQSQAKKMGLESFITRDVEQRKRYLADEKCQFTITVDYADQLAKGIINVGKSKTYNINSNIPILLISGEKDPVGGINNKYIKRISSKYMKNGNPVTVYLYPDAFHNVLQELNRTEVFADVAEWINSAIPAN
jgi:alpha-beta hydrolase superfamily lysophospholipase